MDDADKWALEIARERRLLERQEVLREKDSDNGTDSGEG
jgi:hypothetical protein